MYPLFRVRRFTENAAHPMRAYWIESTAPLNVDDRARKHKRPQPAATDETTRLKESLPVASLEEIATFLNQHHAPEVVITVHGFNNPEKSILESYKGRFDKLANDPAFASKSGLVCIGYKWPSEAMLWPIGTSISAAPGFLLGLSALTVALLVGKSFLFNWLLPALAHLPGIVRFLIYLVELTLISAFFATPFAAFVLRAIVYFRDVYRATQYGIPDLVEVIRNLDLALNRVTPGAIRQEPVKLSFIAHSMGAFVVTGTVRILTDVIAATQSTGGDGSADPDGDVGGNIGRSFCLGRLVMVSPDIPAEALLTRRANFLRASLRRFEEAYLFSNEGDEVLRLISTLANYFSFPTRRRQHGFRLGNLEVVDPKQPGRVAPPPGIANKEDWLAGREPTDAFPRRLRVGSWTLDRLDDELLESQQTQQAVQAPMAPVGPGAQIPMMPARPSRLLERFTYFDCTDYVEAGHPYLTRAKRAPKLQWWNHWSLLATYVFLGKPDVHSGYFQGPFALSLIYRLACLGFVPSLRALDPRATSLAEQIGALDQSCMNNGIQALLAPELRRRLAALEESPQA